MFNKKIVLSMCATVLVAAMAIGGTMAYFTDTDEVSNTINTGKVKINVVETKEDRHCHSTTTKEKVYEGVMPGDKLDKDPTIKIDNDSADCYLRAKIVYKGAIENDLTKQNQLTEGMDIRSQGTRDYRGQRNNYWVKGEDGYYYYQEKVSKNQSINFFNEVKVPFEWDNTLANKTFQIDVVAEAVQSENWNPTLVNGKITSWKYNNSKIVVQDYVE